MTHAKKVIPEESKDEIRRTILSFLFEESHLTQNESILGNTQAVLYIEFDLWLQWAIMQGRNMRPEFERLNVKFLMSIICRSSFLGMTYEKCLISTKQ